MAEGKSLITESTFSHSSKVELVREAKRQGYAVSIYHVAVRSSDIAVSRVASRVGQGGHDVPEQKTRDRFVRNQPLIREALLLADTAKIYDNTRVGTPHSLSIMFEQGHVTRIIDPVPSWARDLYSTELDRFSPAQLNAPAVSFAQAEAATQQALGTDARTFVARSDGSYKGRILAETSMHVVQQIGARSAVAHFKDRLDHTPAIGDQITITYDLQKVMRGHTDPHPTRQVPPMDEERRGRIEAVVIAMDHVAKQLAPERAGPLGPAVASVRYEGSDRLRQIITKHPDALERFERALKGVQAKLTKEVQPPPARGRKHDPDLSR